jgi:excisionase family DNA binding protein
LTSRASALSVYAEGHAQVAVSLYARFKNNHPSLGRFLGVRFCVPEPPLTPGAPMSHPGLARPQLLDADEAAAYLDCSRRTIERLAKAKHLAPVRIGSRVRFRVADLDAFIAAGGARLP